MRRNGCICAGLFVMFLSGCSAVVSDDELNHFTFSAAVASASTAAGLAPVESVCLTAGLGLLKEIYDSRFGTGFSTSDLAADVIGAIAGTLAADICMEDNP